MKGTKASRTKASRTKNRIYQKLIGMKTYRFQWAEYNSYFADIKAVDKEEARKKWEAGKCKKILDDVEVQEDSLRIGRVKWKK